MDVPTAQVGTIDRDEYLATSNLYEHENRPYRDKCCGIFYVVLLSFSVFAGIAAFANGGKGVGQYSGDFFANSTTCDINLYKSLHSDYDYYSSENGGTFSSAYAKNVAIWLPISAVVSCSFAVLFIILFKNYAETMVKVSLYVALPLSLAMAVVALVVGGIGAGILLLIFSVVLLIIMFCMRNQLAMCARLLSIAGRGLKENPLVVSTSLAINAVGLVVILYLVAAFIFALFIGQPVINYGIVERTGSEENGQCFGYDNNMELVAINCCSWQINGWAGAYAFFCWCTIVYTALLVMQLKLYTIADVMAQWYFLPTEVAKAQPVSIKTALRHALGPSFGSNAFASAILAVVAVLRSIFDRMARSNVCCAIINCLVQPILSMVAQFTEFASVFMAIRGVGFISASGDTFSLLRRHALNTYTVWWVPGFVLGVSTLLFSLVWATLAFVVIIAGGGPSGGNASGQAWAVGITVFVLVYFVLRYVSSLLMDVVNTIYICYAMDLDMRRVTKPEFHEIYKDVPTLGAVIENPDGNIAYGSPVPMAASPYSAPYPYARSVSMANLQPGQTYTPYPQHGESSGLMMNQQAYGYQAQQQYPYAYPGTSTPPPPHYSQIAPPVSSNALNVHGNPNNV